MANAVIGALRVNLGINSAQFQNGLKNAQAGLQKFGNAMRVGIAAATSAGTAALGAFAVGVKNTIDGMDDMSKAALKIGIPIEELSKLRYAADLSGVSFESLQTSVGRLSRQMADAASGLKSAQEPFNALGISVQNADGTLKSSTQILAEIADRFAKMENGAAKTALAMELMGRAGAGMIPLLNGGSAALNELMREAEQLGIVIDTHTGRAAEAFNDNITRLQTGFGGLVTKITASLLPSLELATEKFIAFVSNGPDVQGMIDGIGRGVHWMGNEFAQVSILVARLSAEISGLMEALSRFNNYDFSGAWQAWKAGQDASAKMAQDMKAQVDAIFDAGAMGQGAIQRRIDDAFGTAGASAAEKFMVNFENAAKGTSGRVKAAVDPMAREAARIFEETRTPLERYNTEIARLNGLLAQGYINQETYNRAVIQAQDAFDTASKSAEKGLRSMESIGQSVGSTLAGAFSNLIDGSEGFKESLKGVLRQLSSMVINSAFTNFFGGLFGGKGLFGGFRAGGGPVRAGRAYVVGERGPELMVPNASGTVVPNSALGRRGGAGAVIQQSFTFSGAATSEELKAYARQMGAAAVKEVKGSLPGWNVQLGRAGVLT